MLLDSSQIYLDCIGCILFLFIYNFCVSLRCTNIGMSQHLTYRENVCAIAQLERSISMAEAMVNTSLSKRKRNIGGNMVTGCELVVFLCSATDRDRQNSMGY